MKTIKLIIDGKEIEAKIKDEDAETILPMQAKRWKDLGEISGYYITPASAIVRHSGRVNNDNRNLFAKKTQAEGVLAMAQLSQLMKQVNGDWEPDWKEGSQKKVMLVRSTSGGWDIENDAYSPRFLVFKDRETAGQFLEDHQDLLDEYAKIYL